MNDKADEVLDLNYNEEDVLYRIRRGSRVVYVTIRPPTLLSVENHTYKPGVIAALSKHEVWNQEWTTLLISESDGHRKYEKDSFEVHGLSEVGHHYPSWNVLGFEVLGRLKQRVHKVRFGYQTMALKLARFPFELPWLKREAEIYDLLSETSLAPKLIGFADEGDRSRIIGILVEWLEEPHATAKDSERCDERLSDLNKYVLHSDVNRFNIVMTPNGLKFIDFDGPVQRTSIDQIEFEEQEQQERINLKSLLADTSNKGQPLPYA